MQRCESCSMQGSEGIKRKSQLPTQRRGEKKDVMTVPLVSLSLHTHSHSFSHTLLLILAHEPTDMPDQE